MERIYPDAIPWPVDEWHDDHDREAAWTLMSDESVEEDDA